MKKSLAVFVSAVALASRRARHAKFGQVIA